MLAVLALSVTPASEASETRRMVAFGSKFVPGDDDLPLGLSKMRINAGDALEFRNLDSDGHKVVSFDRDQDEVPLFQSETTSRFQDPVDVTGVSTLAPSSYRFYCAFHPGMEGTLLVD